LKNWEGARWGRHKSTRTCNLKGC